MYSLGTSVWQGDGLFCREKEAIAIAIAMITQRWGLGVVGGRGLLAGKYVLTKEFYRTLLAGFLHYGAQTDAAFPHQDVAG